MITDVEVIPNFSEPHKPPKKFRIDDDVFECAPELPAGASTFLVKMSRAGDMERVAMLGDFLDMIVLPESAERFAARMISPKEPITISQLLKVIEFLMETYTGRPTQPSSSSADGLTPTGLSLMDGLPLGV